MRVARELLIAAAITLGTADSLAAQAPAGPPPRTPSPCPSTAVNHELDFWIGTWTVTPWTIGPNTPPGAGGVNVVEQDLEQCLLVENWRAGNGSRGRSFNFYDTNQKKWRQVWVDESGGSLDYTGEFRDGAMRFEGWTLAPNGKKALQRLTFTPYGKDTVRQTFTSSTDDGKTWPVGFDGRYVRVKNQP